MAGLSICTQPPIKLQPGDWLIQYISSGSLRIHIDGADQVIKMSPLNMIIAQEIDALKFLAMIQRQDPTLLHQFSIISR